MSTATVIIAILTFVFGGITTYLGQRIIKKLWPEKPRRLRIEELGGGRHFTGLPYAYLNLRTSNPNPHPVSISDATLFWTREDKLMWLPPYKGQLIKEDKVGLMVKQVVDPPLKIEAGDTIDFTLVFLMPFDPPEYMDSLREGLVAKLLLRDSFDNIYSLPIEL
jgi:hypothetical protein